jgi:hypothetical protein
LNQPNVESDKFESDAELKAFQYRAYDLWQRLVVIGIEKGLEKAVAITEADAVIYSLKRRLQ